MIAHRMIRAGMRKEVIGVQVRKVECFKAKLKRSLDIIKYLPI